MDNPPPAIATWFAWPPRQDDQRPVAWFVGGMPVAAVVLGIAVHLTIRGASCLHVAP